MIISVAGCWSATLIVPENIKKDKRRRDVEYENLKLCYRCYC